MTMTLAPVPISDIQAIYNNRGRYLELIAKGMLPTLYFNPYFAQENWDCGLRFSLLTRPGASALSRRYHQPYEAKHKLHVTFPLSSLNIKSVVIQTARGIWEVPIQQMSLPVRSNDINVDSLHKKSRYGVSSKDVRSPVRKQLAWGQSLVIQAEVPDPNSEVKPLFNPDNIRMVDASINNNTMTWKFRWTKVPTQDDATHLIDILIKTRNSKYGSGSSVQGYIIESVSSKSSQNVMESKINDFVYGEHYYYC